MRITRADIGRNLLDDAERYRFCGPSDDPDEQTAVTAGYRHLVIQFKRLFSSILPAEPASRLNAIDVEVNNIYSAYDAKAELEALFPDMEDALEYLSESSLRAGNNVWIVDPALITRLGDLKSDKLDGTTLCHICKEINSSYSHGNILATILLMRTVLNHIPPAFGQETFAQVVANVSRSLKTSFEHLENGLRKVADFHAHRTVAAAEFYPSSAQIEPYKPQFELLLQQVETRIM